MFLSIPKEFFVPVVFNDNFILNNENNNMEYDTNSYRENIKGKVSENKTVKKVTVENKPIEMKKEISNNSNISCDDILNEALSSMKNTHYIDIDNEYVLEKTKQKDDNCE